MVSHQHYIRQASATEFDVYESKALLKCLDIELTERCNNSCQHCYINLPENDAEALKEELTTDQWKNILQQAANLGVLTVRFTGGEPLIRRDFTELYMFARRLGMKVMLFTNGRGITPEIAKLLASVPPLEAVEITVYGMHPESYDDVACSPGAYAEFRQGVELLLKHKVRFTVKGVLLPQNMSEIDEFESWAATLTQEENPPSITLLLEMRCRHNSSQQNKRIQDLRMSPEDVVKTINRHKEIYIKDTERFIERFIGPKGNELFCCGAGKAISIDAYGRIQPCLMMRDPSLVFDSRCYELHEALEAFPEMLKQKRATNPNYLSRCSRCFLNGLCEQCPAKSWSEHRTLDTPVEYFCNVAHAQAYDLGLLEEGEYGWEVEDWRERVTTYLEREKLP
jgi:radical SAM protein with 4Fe4S-binding SPASM domain